MKTTNETHMVFNQGVKFKGQMFSSAELTNYIGEYVKVKAAEDKLEVSSLSNKPICEFCLQQGQS